MAKCSQVSFRASIACRSVAGQPCLWVGVDLALAACVQVELALIGRLALWLGGVTWRRVPSRPADGLLD